MSKISKKKRAREREIPIENFLKIASKSIYTGFEVERGKGFQFTKEGTILPLAFENHQIQASGMS